MHRGQWLVAGLALAVALAAGAWFGRPPAPFVEPAVEPVVALPATVGTGAAGRLTVHVSGAVVSSGLVALPAGSRVADAIAAAGGAAADADLAAVNLASPLVDGSQVIVPARGAARDRGGAGPPGAGPGPVPLNSATVDELQELPGIGPVTAGRIVAHREAHGPFGAVEDLLDVPGIGETRLAALRDLVAAP